MEKQDEFSWHDNADGDIFSLTDILPTMWQARWLIAGLTSLTMALALLGGLFFAKYKSEGFLQFGGPIPMPKEKILKDKDKEISPGIVLADYKRYAATFASGDRFAGFVEQNKLDATPGIAKLRRTFASPEGISKMIEPVYPFTKLDAKELMEQPKDASNNVIGLRVSYEADSPENAQHMAAILGRYTMDSIVYLVYSDALRFKHTEITARITKLDNDIIDNRERLESYRRRGAALKQIVSRYPKAGDQAERQVVTVTEDNARFLSPTTHLMATEVETSQANEAILAARREQQQSLLLREYYDQAKQLLEASKSGEAVLRGLEPVKERVFKNKNLNDELVKEVYNSISIDNQNAISLYLEKSRFIAGPSLPENRSTRLSTVLALSFLLGLFGASALVFGRSWWRANRQKLAD